MKGNVIHHFLPHEYILHLISFTYGSAILRPQNNPLFSSIQPSLFSPPEGPDQGSMNLDRLFLLTSVQLDFLFPRKGRQLQGIEFQGQ
jgi:hypothetical protein